MDLKIILNEDSTIHRDGNYTIVRIPDRDRAYWNFILREVGREQNAQLIPVVGEVN